MANETPEEIAGQAAQAGFTGTGLTTIDTVKSMGRSALDIGK